MEEPMMFSLESTVRDLLDLVAPTATPRLMVKGYKPAADWRDLLSDGQRYFLNASRAESLEDRRKWISMALQCGRQAKDLC